MTPDEIAIINSKLDTLTRETSKLTTATQVLATEFKAHRDAEQKSLELREATCPKGQIVSKLAVDVDAIAGAVRRNTGRLDALEAWHDACQRDAAVDGAERGIIMAPLKWLWKNSEKVLVAVAIAYIIYRLGV